VNVLLTSAGAGVAIVRAFARAAAARGGSVFVADADPLAPAATVAAGSIGVPSADDRSYLPTLLAAVEAHDVRVLIPLADAELPFLSAGADAFASLGCTVVVSQPDFVAMASDKLATVHFCREHGVRTPTTWSPSDLDGADLPHQLFVRPRHGSGSRHARPVSLVGLRDAVDALPDCIVQEELRRAEITVDALLDFDGTPIHYVPRLRLRVEAGRSVRAVTVDRPVLGAWAIRVLRLFGEHGARGLLSVQTFFGPGEPVLIEVNARIAHGLPLTIAAGGDYPEWVLQLVDGHRPDATLGVYRSGVSMATYPEPIIWDET
jgi:carbamoyl-phosphate synthase large subunit